MKTLIVKRMWRMPSINSEPRNNRSFQVINVQVSLLKIQQKLIPPNERSNHENLAVHTE